MPSTHMKIHSTSIVTKIIQIKSVRYHFLYWKNAKSDNTKHCQENREKGNSHTGRISYTVRYHIGEQFSHI